MPIQIISRNTPALLNRGFALRRWATGVRWIEILTGLLYTALWLTDPSDVLLILLGILGALTLAGQATPLYRRAFYFRRNPTLFLPGTLVLDESGITGTTATSTWNNQWTYWQTRLLFPDLVLLFNKATGNATMLAISRPDGRSDEDWAALQQLVRERVAPQPRRFGLPRSALD